MFATERKVFVTPAYYRKRKGVVCAYPGLSPQVINKLISYSPDLFSRTGKAAKGQQFTVNGSTYAVPEKSAMYTPKPI